MKFSFLIGILGVLVTTTVAARASSGATYSVDSSKSAIRVDVFKEGLLKAFGHEHQIAAKSFSGTVHFDADRLEESALSLEVEARSLTVIDPGESEQDRRDVQATMEAQVLGVNSFPLIRFRSTGVRLLRNDGAGWLVTLAGRLNLHGVEKPVSFPVRVRLDNRRLTAHGEVFIAQTVFGIEPVRVAGGMVRVQDRVKVSFSIVAERHKP